jgi:histidinol-phosphatase (PHP family)
MVEAAFVSVHGGHSSEFCSHAEDKLEEIIMEYIKKGFLWVGITEHVPPFDEKFVYPQERKVGLTAKIMQKKFHLYIKHCKELKKKYQEKIEVLVAFETEAYTGAFKYAESLIEQYSPDYFVGSVHHVNDLDFDTSKETYQQALEKSGSYEQLYLDYFDLQYEMLQKLRPPVVGHFDLIRIYDPDYRLRLQNKSIWMRIVRNLKLIKQLDLILDFNLRSLLKGASEPYVSEAILEQVLQMGIKIAPGDDSHRLSSVGLNLH